MVELHLLKPLSAISPFECYRSPQKQPSLVHTVDKTQTTIYTGLVTLLTHKNGVNGHKEQRNEISFPISFLLLAEDSPFHEDSRRNLIRIFIPSSMHECINNNSKRIPNYSPPSSIPLHNPLHSRGWRLSSPSPTPVVNSVHIFSPVITRTHDNEKTVKRNSGAKIWW